MNHILGNRAKRAKPQQIPKKRNNPLYLIGSPQLKVRIQQQHKSQETYKFIEIEQCSVESPLDQGRNVGRN